MLKRKKSVGNYARSAFELNLTQKPILKKEPRGCKRTDMVVDSRL